MPQKTPSQTTPVLRMKPRQNTKARQPARINARPCTLLCAEATRPAASASRMELKLTSIEYSASLRPNPPVMNGTVTTGSTASHKLNAVKPWASPLASTMSRALSGVRNSSGSVPSRRSRLMQSAVTSGTRTQIATNVPAWRQAKTAPPSFQLTPGLKASQTQTASNATTPFIRRV